MKTFIADIYFKVRSGSSRATYESYEYVHLSFHGKTVHGKTMVKNSKKYKFIKIHDAILLVTNTVNYV